MDTKKGGKRVREERKRGRIGMKKEERPGKDKVPYWQFFSPLLVLPVVVGL